MTKRKTISDEIVGMLKEQVVHVCPLGLSSSCERFEKIERPFTNHHIDLNPANSEYWNLIRICEPCHEAHNQRTQDGDLQRKIKFRKKALALQYLGPLAVSVLRMAHQHEATSAMPAMVLKLLEKGYVEISNHNTFSAGSCAHATMQDYKITQRGKELIEKLLGASTASKDGFAL
jgi:hypothetical protein